MTFKGSVSWAIGATAFTASGLITNKVQSFDMTRKSDNEEVKDQNGEVCGWVKYNFSRDISFEGIAFVSGSNNGTLSVTMVEPGTALTVTSDCAALATGSFYVTEGSIKATNTSCKAVSIKATAHDNVSGATS